MTACGGGTIGYMWVLGQQYNQISGFKIDDYTGNLTAIQKSPFGTGGTVPVFILVKPGGRYVYVINQGTPPATGAGTGYNTSSGIVEFAVGGDGTLTYQNSYSSQGFNPVWAQFDGSGSYLYVLDKYSPTITNGVVGPNSDGNGAITAFAIDPSTGRLTLVQNSQTQVNGVDTTFFEVGGAPIMMKTAGNCLYTVNSVDQTITPFQFNAGQLVSPSPSTISTPAAHISSINGNSTYVYLTDSASNNIFPYTNSGSCNLQPVTGGQVPNIAGTSQPTYSIVDNSGKYVYVLNQSTTTTQPGTPFSSISAFTINSTTGQLVPIVGAPYPVGSGPVCMVEDTSNQYVYVSTIGGTVTGKVIDSTTGTLTDLTRGSTFPSAGVGSCLALSGNVDD